MNVVLSHVLVETVLEAFREPRSSINSYIGELEIDNEWSLATVSGSYDRFLNRKSCRSGRRDE